MNLDQKKILFYFPSIGNVIFLSIFLFFSFTAQRLLDDGDTGYHIKAGEFIIENHFVPKVDIFSFHTPAIPWIAHEWLSEVLMGWVHIYFGLNGVVILFSFTIASLFYLLFRFIKKNNGNIIISALLVILSALTSYFHWLARPHIFSLLLSLIWYFILEEYQYRNRRIIYYLPFLMVLWVNVHGGFIFGLLMIGVYFLGNLIEMSFSGEENRNNAKKKGKRYILVGLLCLGAAFINPNGYRILVFPFALVFEKSLVNYSNEFLSPNFHHIFFVFFAIYLLFTIGIFMISKKMLRPTEIILVMLLTYMSLYSCRNIALFSIIIAPILSRQIEYLLEGKDGNILIHIKNKAKRYNELDRYANGILWPLMGVILVIAATKFGMFNFRFEEKMRKPVKAVEFLRKEPIKGNMFNADEFGDYIIYSAYPQYKVFIDGRIDIYNPKILSDYQRISNFENGWENVIEKYQIKWIIYDKDSPLSRYLLERKDWRLIYSDEVTNIFVRNIEEFKSLIEKYNSDPLIY